MNYREIFESNNVDLQTILDKVNELPEATEGVELPTLTNEGTAADLLSGKQLIDGDGNIVTGTIQTQTVSDLSASGSTVTVPAGYYATQATKSVATATRANTTISVTADDTNDKLTITASNNQSTGYVTGANKTATTTISLTANGSSVTASDGNSSISKSVSTATQATPSITVDSAGKITASSTQSAGYVNSGTKSATKQLTTMAGKTVTPGTSVQTVVSAGTFVTGDIKVAAVSDGGSGGNTSVEDGLLTRTLTEIRNDRIKRIGEYAFFWCVDLTKADFPVATSVGIGAFDECYSLTTVDLPAVTSIEDLAFELCEALTTVDLSSVVNIGSSAFYNCPALETLDLPIATSIGSSAFSWCSSLKTLILRSTGVAKLVNKNAFTGTPIASGTGYIYVPRALLSDDDATKDYRRATNWSTYASRFRAIEDYPDICGEV